MDRTEILVEGLSKTYPGGVEAVRAISFEVAPGEVFGLLGPNGAGKSTTVGMLTTAIRPTAGSARVAGFDVATQAIEARRASSVVFQDAVVDRPLSGRANLTHHGRLWGVGRDDIAHRTTDLAESFGLTKLLDRSVASYSGGERRRLEIARALLSQPRVLFLDEPTVGLDPGIRFELLDHIASLRGRGEITTLLTTHYLDEARRLCDRVAILHEGRVVAVGAPEALIGALGSEILEVRVEGQPAAALAALRVRGVAGERAFVVGSTVTIPLEGRPGHEAVATIGEMNLAVAAVSVRPPTLDDVYLRLTGAPLAA